MNILKDKEKKCRHLEKHDLYEYVRLTNRNNRTALVILATIGGGIIGFLTVFLFLT